MQRSIVIEYAPNWSVEYIKKNGKWYHAGSGNEVSPICADGSTMSPKEFRNFIKKLEECIEE